ncbi:hypothetical protein XSR1_70004 [Xenorhabdus szentirmaii DSM 16338]|uniref:Uncharacterized protein n=1 Tax=Xenorhabdus szentirmaii DSM 16338 TaxID=1427518 RepID=W1J3C1_9GAMM|nr:hypothetical protein XSR1_70004 [Xenorhabdus szentirmaii DSM 16338]
MVSLKACFLCGLVNCFIQNKIFINDNYLWPSTKTINVKSTFNWITLQPHINCDFSL